jgi:murein DD-endopeptidase MepM/ murein hydrolase activator NlpD
LRLNKILLVAVILVAACHYCWLLYQGGQDILIFQENQTLKQEVLSVRKLARELASLRDLNRKMRRSLGEQFGAEKELVSGDHEYSLLPDEPFPGSVSLPTSSPVDGLVSRGFNRIGWPGELDHPGLDFAATSGSPVYATAGGVVLFTGRTSTWGQLVILYHGNGLTSWYGHIVGGVVSLGERITRGQVVGLVAESEDAGGSHLHYAIQQNGIPVDPLRYLNEIVDKE